MLKHTAVIVFALVLWHGVCPAGETFNAIQRNRQIKCGVDVDMPGFAAKDGTGTWVGMDVDFCRAASAALFDDPNRCSFVPLSARARFTSLMSREIDVLTRRTTWTTGREAAFGVRFVGAYFITGQAFMVRAEDAAKGLSGLNKAKVAVIKGATHEGNLGEVAERFGLHFEAALFEDPVEAGRAFLSGDSQGITGDHSMLAVMRTLAPNGPDRYVILPEFHSTEPLAPVVRQDDGIWLTTLRGVLGALIAAEEYGLDQAKARAGTVDSILAKQFLVDADLTGKSLGLKPGWVLRVVAAVGNYGEIFNRHLGAGSPFKLDRGLNRLWKDGGMLWAPPF